MEDITNSNGLERFPQLCISTLDQFSLKKKDKCVAITCLSLIR